MPRKSAHLVVLAGLLLGQLVACADSDRGPVLGGGAEPPANTCSTPNTGCPCSSEGESVKCGETVEQQGDVVTCAEGTRRCSGGQWGACSGEQRTQIYVPSTPAGGLRVHDLAGSPESCMEPCDPYCQTLADTPEGLDAGTDFVTDEDGLTLSTGSFTGGNCPDLAIEPQAVTVTITGIAADGSVTPSEPVSFDAVCNPAGYDVQPSWTIDSYDRAVIDAEGDLTVYSGIAGPIQVTGASSVDSDDAVVEVVVDIEDRGDDPAVAEDFDAGSVGPDTGKTLYPYKNTVFPLDLKAPLVQWDTGGTAASDVKVSLRYPAGSASPTFSYSRIFDGLEPSEGTIAPSAPAWQIPQEIWSAFDRSAAGGTGEIVVQRRYGGDVRDEMVIPVTFASDSLRGTVYYTQYLRRLFTANDNNAATNLCGAGNGNQLDIDPDTYTLGTVCPVGNCTHPSVANTSTTRAIDLSTPTATNHDPFNGTSGCPACHSVSANGSVYVSGSEFLQVWPGGGTSSGVNTIGLSGTGEPTFTAVAQPSNYVVPRFDTDWDSRGFAYAGLTPDGAYALQGPYFWGNTVNTPAGNNTQNATATGTTGRLRPYFLVSTGNPGPGVHYATTAALSNVTYGTNTITSTTTATLTVDGVNVTNGAYVLVKNEADARYNGVYTKGVVMSGTRWQLTRRNDADLDSQLTGGMEVRVTDGNTNWNKVFYISSVPDGAAVDIGTDDIALTERTVSALPAMMTPVFSPDGTKLAYVNGDADTLGGDSTGWRRGLTMYDFQQSSRTVSGKKRLVNHYGATAGTPVKWPFFESDSRSLVYVETHPNEYCSSLAESGQCPVPADDTYANASCATSSGFTVDSNIERACYQSAYGSMSPTTRGFWPGRLFSIDTGAGTPSATRTELAKANDAEDAADADKAYQPTVLPVSAGGYRWVIFTSPRSYGNQFNQVGTHFSCGAAMLWVTALSDETASDSDRSNPAFFLPGQNVAPVTQQDHYVNERGYLVPSPCKATGASCTSDDECCGSEDDPASAACRVDAGWSPEDGPPSKSCAPISGTCQNEGDSCASNADCCSNSCVDFACAPVPTYEWAAFVRDFEAECPDGFHPRWGLFNYHLTTGADSSIDFELQTASTLEDLDDAATVELPETFEDTPTGDPESFDSGQELADANEPNTYPFLRVTMILYPSEDGFTAPILHDWEQLYTCVPAE